MSRTVENFPYCAWQHEMLLSLVASLKKAGFTQGKAMLNVGTEDTRLESRLFSKKPRIMLIMTEFPPSIGGMQTHAIIISKFFKKNGANVVLYTYRSIEDELLTNNIDKNFDFPIIRKLSRISYYKNLSILKNAAEEFKPNLIYSSTIFYGILQNYTKIPVVCRSVGNDVMRPWIVYPFMLGHQAAALFFVEKYLYKTFIKIRKPEIVEILFRKKRLKLAFESAKAASFVIANSQFTFSLLKDAGVCQEKIKLAVGGVDTSFFDRKAGCINTLRQQLGIPPESKILLTACRLVDKKGVDFLLRSMDCLKKRKQGFHLLIVGDGRRKKRLEELSRLLGVDDSVTFAGSVPYERMPEYYSAADIFVLASTLFIDKKTGLKDAETMGRVLCEANASGIPVVATNSGGIPSVVAHGKNGLLFPENDMEEFLRCIDKICLDQKLKESLVRHGWLMSRQIFDWSNIIAIHESVFSKASA